jgi:hypothetical protein
MLLHPKIYKKELKKMRKSGIILSELIKKKGNRRMIKHIVFWRLKPEIDKIEAGKRIKEELEGLKSKIEYLRFIQVGINFEASDAAYDVALVTEFDTREDLGRYQANPDHQAAAEYVRFVAAERAVVDYEY